MQQTIDPSFEFNGSAVLFGALVTLIGGLGALFFLHRPGWLLVCGLVGGMTAGMKSGLYEQSATNGFVAAGLGALVLFPAIALYRSVIIPATVGTGDVLFISVTLTVVDIIAYGPLMCVLGYLGGTLVDIVRRRASGRLSY